MTRIARWLVFLFLAGLGASASHAQTINAASCNATDVQVAVNAATVGATVVIPAGTCTWTTPVNWTPPNGVTLIGAGNQAVVGGGDVTTIIDNVSHAPADTATLQITTGTPASTFRMSGFSMISNSASTASFNGSIRFLGNSTNVRIDHVHLAMTADGKQMTIAGCVYGVMDHSILDLKPGTTFNGVFQHQGACGGDASNQGNGQWNLPTALGSANSFYFENNVFNGGTTTSNNTPVVNDCSGGGRFVYRFNTFNGPSIQGHATGHAGDDRSCRAWEIYANTYTSTGTSAAFPSFTAFFTTGGTGVIWGNMVGGFYTHYVVGDIDRTNTITYIQQNPPTGWGYCSSTPFGGVGGPSNWDGNFAGQNGYPCLDQIGRGAGDLLSGSFPTKCNANSSDCTNRVFTGRWPNQALEPVYEWSDIWTPVPQNASSVFWGQQNAQALLNRDYYLWCNPASNTGCKTFDGSTGVGSGTLSTRPSTCTKGVGYFATDQGNWNNSGSGGQGVLFVCTATNTWSLYYTPFTYPHPLVMNTPSANPPTGATGTPH